MLRRPFPLLHLSLLHFLVFPAARFAFGDVRLSCLTVTWKFRACLPSRADLKTILLATTIANVCEEEDTIVSFYRAALWRYLVYLLIKYLSFCEMPVGSVTDPWR